MIFTLSNVTFFDDRLHLHASQATQLKIYQLRFVERLHYNYDWVSFYRTATHRLISTVIIGFISPQTYAIKRMIVFICLMLLIRSPDNTRLNHPNCDGPGHTTKCCHFSNLHFCRLCCSCCCQLFGHLYSYQDPLFLTTFGRSSSCFSVFDFTSPTCDTRSSLWHDLIF